MLRLDQPGASGYPTLPLWLTKAANPTVRPGHEPRLGFSRFKNGDSPIMACLKLRQVNGKAPIIQRVIFTTTLILVLAFLCPQPVSARGKTQYRNSSFEKFVQIAGASRVGSDACMSCHSDIASNFRHAFHAQQGVECEDCHGPGSLHVDGGGDVAKIISFRSRPAEQANGVCLSCHIQNSEVRNWMSGPHAADGVRCTDCHQVHASASPAPAPTRANFDTTNPGSVTLVERLVPESTAKLEPRWQLNESCLKCHQEQRAEMSLPYHHPLREGKLTCVDCHNPHGGPGGRNLRNANVNQLCLSCHAQYRGPYMYQHPPVNENCMICHSPHGSPNTNLLTVSEPALCLQCHAGHHDGASLPLADRCTNCHGSIHGTDVPTPTGGSRFVDKGGLGVPGFPQPTTLNRLAQLRTNLAMPLVPAHTPTGIISMGLPSTAVFHGSAPASSRYSPSLVPSHSPFTLSSMAPYAGVLAAMYATIPNRVSAGNSWPAAGAAPQDSYWGLYFTPGAYRFVNVTGYGSRVGEYDSLQEAEGGGFEANYISVPHHTSLLTRATVLTGSDFHVVSQLNVGDRLEVGADMRSFVEQQDNYPFYAGVMSPDIVNAEGDPSLYDGIPAGTVFGVKRRLGSAYARVKLPKVPVHLFVKGDWQARVGHTQFAYLDENIDSTCTTCHFTSQLQRLNYTTRNAGAGVEVNLGGMDLTYEHDYSSFNDRLPYPSATLGPMLNEVEPGPVFVPDTPAGTYYLDIPASSRYSADALSLNWSISPDLIFNGQASYRREHDVLTHNPQNAFDSDATLSWHPRERLRLTADYRQQNLVNSFVPYFTLYGNMSYHEHWAGLKADYDLTKHLDVEAHYQRSGISRSNAFLWPQIYSFDNTDLLTVVPSSFSNTTGVALRYHPRSLWNARAGYEWTGTHDPGYLLVPKSNSRIFGNVTFAPTHWLIFTDDGSIIVQNAFPIIQRRNRFYVDTADATLKPLPNWDLELGYSYQQNNLATYMAFQNDAGAGYVLDEPFVAYRQLSQTYWIQSAYKFRNRLGLNLGLTHSSAHSGMLPDLNPNDYLLLGNGPVVQQGAFDPVLFQQALGALNIGATQVSQVNVPQFIGQGKVYLLLPHGFDSGILVNYSSYRDYTHPNLDGILRAYTVYVGRSW